MCSEQVLDADRQLSQPFACCVKDRIGDCRRRAHHRHFSKPLHPDAVRQQIGLINEIDFNLTDVGVYRHHIVGEVIVEETAVARVDFSRLAQRGAECPDDAAPNLARGGARADHAPAIGDAHPRAAFECGGWSARPGPR